MSAGDPQVEQDRALLKQAQENGAGSTLAAFVKLSGPGWLQSAITLGGGSLAGALFLGILGGTSMLWLQLVAIVMGVIMLSAISYVTLSTGERPFQAINNHINPVLGWGWLIATMLANMIWCMPQFSLSFAALQKNLLPDMIEDTIQHKVLVSELLLLVAGGAVFLNSQKGTAAKVFDWFLKGLVGIVVICFVGVVGLLTYKGAIDWNATFAGFIPDLGQWNRPAGKLAELVAGMDETAQKFWTEKIVASQRSIMIGAAATAVGINMTFLLPYSMLRRGWDKTFRGLARFDLSTGMAIPYIVVTSCVVIAASAKFHAQIDDNFKSTDPAVMQTSKLFTGDAQKALIARVAPEGDGELTDEIAAKIAALPEAEKIAAASVLKRNAFDLSEAIAPLLGETNARLAFGLGILGMGFSTIIILMLINGFVFCEIANKPLGGMTQFAGCVVAGVAGMNWWWFWDGQSKVYLAIVTSNFGMMLLPIAYVTFLFMMNSKKILGDDKPTGFRLIVWNTLMVISCIGALVAAASAVWNAMTNPDTGIVVITIGAVFVLAVIAGFVLKKDDSSSSAAEA